MTSYYYVPRFAPSTNKLSDRNEELVKRLSFKWKCCYIGNRTGCED